MTNRKWRNVFLLLGILNLLLIVTPPYQPVWMVVDAGFSAVAFYMARQSHKEIKK